MRITDIRFKKEIREHLITCLPDFEQPSRVDLKETFKTFEKSITAGDFVVARNSLIVLVYFQSDETIKSIRKKGLFRYSKYTNRKCIVKNIAVELIDICRSLDSLSTQIEDYLNSIVNYSTILDSYNSFDEFFLKEIKNFQTRFPGKSIIKTILAYTDYLFLSNHLPSDEKDDLSNLSGRTKEEISSATSFIIQYYTKRVKSQHVDTAFVSIDYIRSGDIARLLIPACYQEDFREFEILIDHFDYRCIVRDDKLEIKPPYEKFEKSIRLGYIRTNLQKVNDLLSSELEADSLDDLADEVIKRGDFDFFQKIEDPVYSRYRLAIPEPIYDFLIENFIRPSTLFKEELLYLSSIAKEQILEVSELERIVIKNDLTLAEFIRIRRAFLLFFLLFQKGLYQGVGIKTDDLLRSLIPVFPEPQFYQMIEKLIPNGKLDTFIDLICWEPGIDSALDLQYHPLLFFDKHFLLPLSIFANSNTVRNLYASEYKKSNTTLLRDGKFDPLVDYLISSLSKAAIPCYHQISLGFTDIDALAFYGDALLVFECKHSLHPTSIFDLRTTYDYIKKAETQLDQIMDDFHNGDLLKKIETKLGIQLPKINKVLATIVLSNRLFNGNLFKYPVRSINEVDNMINIGTMRTPHGVFWLWKEKRLTPEFLFDYFSNECLLPELMYDSLSKKRLNFEFARPPIELETYYLDMQVAGPKLVEFTSSLKKKN